MTIIQIIPSLEVGGAEKVVQSLAEELDRYENVRLIVVSLYRIETPITQALENNGIEIIYLDKQSGFDAGVVKKLHRLFKQLKPDVIHAHLYALLYAGLALVGTGVKGRFYTVHSMAEKEVGRHYQLFYRWCFKHLGFRPVAISQEVKSSICDTYKLDSHQVSLVHNGISTTKFKQKSDYSLANPPVLLHVGSFKSAKNHTFLLDCLHQLVQTRPMKLRLAGDGPLMSEMKEKVSQLGLEQSVDFLGQRDDINELLVNSDLMVLPSLWEGQPITLIEAMATAMPIIATNVGGVSSLIEHDKSGLLTEVDQDQFTDAVNNLLDNQVKRQRLGQTAYLNSHDFTAEKMAQNYYHLYQEYH